MPDEEAPTTEAETAPSEATDEAPPQLTVEEVEALWKNRVSQKDKAHAAAEKVLRDQLAEAQAQRTSAPPDGEAAQTEALKEQLKSLQQQVEEERVKNLQMKYPVLAQQVGDDVSLFKTTDEATLAKLNALGEMPPGAPPLMDHSMPKRASAAGQPPREPTSDELKGQLLKEEAAWKEAQGY